jgi:hypothetical protein
MPGVWSSPWRDSFGSSRIILPDVIARCEILGEPVAIVPDRDTLLVTGSLDEIGLASLAHLAGEILDGEGRTLSGVAMISFGGSWSPFLPEPDHPAYQSLKRLSLKSRAKDGNEHAQLLNQRPEGPGFAPAEDLTVFRGPEPDAITSSCAWPSDTDVLLPESEYIFFLTPNETGTYTTPAIAEWDVVFETFGHLLEAEPIYPPRFRTRGFPEPGPLAAINVKQRFENLSQRSG